MIRPICRIHAIAIAVTTELVYGVGDFDVIDALTEPLPDAAAPTLRALIDAYADYARDYGVDALKALALHVASQELRPGGAL